jgi:ABC-2 type transport system permease protein
MKNFKTVFKFEYGKNIKTKGFLYSTLGMLGLMMVWFSVSTVLYMMNSANGGINNGMQKAIILDVQNMYSEKILLEYLPGYTWSFVQNLQDLEELIKEEEYQMGLKIDGLNYTIYVQNQRTATQLEEKIKNMIEDVNIEARLKALYITDEEIYDILNLQVQSYVISNYEYSTMMFIRAYTFLIFVYVLITKNAMPISNSIISEKTTKLTDLLITTVKPIPLMFGKVLGMSCVLLTQIFILTGTSLILMPFMGDNNFNPTGVVLQPVYLALILIFSVLAIFIYTFMYVSIAVCCKNSQEFTNYSFGVTMLLTSALFISIFSLNSINAQWVHTLSYVPFITPIGMIAIIYLGAGTMMQYIVGVVISIITLSILGYVAAKMYKKLL